MPIDPQTQARIDELNADLRKGGRRTDPERIAKADELAGLLGMPSAPAAPINLSGKISRKDPMQAARANEIRDALYENMAGKRHLSAIERTQIAGELGDILSAPDVYPPQA